MPQQPLNTSVVLSPCPSGDLGTSAVPHATLEEPTNGVHGRDRPANASPSLSSTAQQPGAGDKQNQLTVEFTRGQEEPSEATTYANSPSVTSGSNRAVSATACAQDVKRLPPSATSSSFDKWTVDNEVVEPSGHFLSGHSGAIDVSVCEHVETRAAPQQRMEGCFGGFSAPLSPTRKPTHSYGVPSCVASETLPGTTLQGSRELDPEENALAQRGEEEASEVGDAEDEDDEEEEDDDDDDDDDDADEDGDDEFGDDGDESDEEDDDEVDETAEDSNGAGLSDDTGVHGNSNEEEMRLPLVECFSAIPPACSGETTEHCVFSNVLHPGASTLSSHNLSHERVAPGHTVSPDLHSLNSMEPLNQPQYTSCGALTEVYPDVSVVNHSGLGLPLNKGSSFEPKEGMDDGDSMRLVSLAELFQRLSPLMGGFDFMRRRPYAEIDAVLVAYRSLDHRNAYQGKTALHHAIATRDYAALALLLRSRRRSELINERDQLGRTPLHLALLSTDVVATQLLLSRPLLPSLQDSFVANDTFQPAPEDLALDMDVDFPDLCLSFGKLPCVHLPLASANTEAAVVTYTLLLGYIELARLALKTINVFLSDGATEIPRTVFTEACGWVNQCEDWHHEEKRKRRMMESEQHNRITVFCGTNSADSNELLPKANESETEDQAYPRPLPQAMSFSDEMNTGFSRFCSFLENQLDVYDVKTHKRYWNADVQDPLGSSSLHRACSFGRASIVSLLLDAGADALLKDSCGCLPVHRAIDSGNEETFLLLLRRGGAVIDRRVGSPQSGLDPWNEDTSIVALFKHCILRGSWTCLGRLVTDTVYSQFPMSETEFDHVMEFSHLCGFSEAFSETFKAAVDGSVVRESESNAVGWPRTTRRGQTQPITLKILAHDDCYNHLPLSRRGDLREMRKFRLYFKYPENPSRLQCLVSPTSGILRCGLFNRAVWDVTAPPASIADILRVHEWSYIYSVISRLQSLVQTQPLTLGTAITGSIVELDGDTPLTAGSWEAARRAAGAAISAVNAVCSGETRAAFCAIRPPGHHVGTFGPCQPPGEPGTESRWEIPSEEDWAQGSQGFCLLNNVAIAAAYARYRYASVGIRRIAIVDFDIHHGNGTDQIVKNLKPRQRLLQLNGMRGNVGLKVEYKTQFWKPWLDESDPDEVFFASMHGYGERFYPNTGGSSSDAEHPNIHNVPVPRNMRQDEFRALFKERVMAPLAAFQPDLILISAGFDGHNEDPVNELYGPCTEWDFEWFTRLLVAAANDFCNGRIVSVLEGGYNVKAGALSPLAQSVAYHVRALLQTSPALTLAAASTLDEHVIQSVRMGGRLVADARDVGQGNPGKNLAGSYTEETPAPKRKKRAAAVKALAHILEEQSQGNRHKKPFPDTTSPEFVPMSSSSSSGVPLSSTAVPSVPPPINEESL